MIKVGDFVRRKGERYPLGKVVTLPHGKHKDGWIEGHGTFRPEWLGVHYELCSTNTQDYIGMRGVFYDELKGQSFLGELKDVFESDGEIFYVFSHGIWFQYFIPCETTSTDVLELTPDKCFTLGPLGVVNE